MAYKFVRIEDEGGELLLLLAEVAQAQGLQPKQIVSTERLAELRKLNQQFFEKKREEALNGASDMDNTVRDDPDRDPHSGEKGLEE